MMTLLLCCMIGLNGLIGVDPGASGTARLQDRPGQKKQVPAGKASEEVLTPLTDEERALDLRELIANQPDFAADLKFFVSEHKIGGAYGFAYRLARKGQRFRKESQFWIIVGEIGKTTARLFPGDKTYDDMEPARGGSTEEGDLLFDPRILLQEVSTTFTALGSRDIEGHKCIKIEVLQKDRPEKIYLHAARDLKNLIIFTQTIGPVKNTGASLSDITLNVPDDLVQIPADYKVIERDRWVKVEPTLVTFGGKPAPDAVVFRAPGGELFIRVKDWTYLVRPSLRTAETAFQGLLVTRSGEYVWQTREREAFSMTDYRVPRPRGPYDPSDEEKRATITPNSVRFRSTWYERDKSMIEVRW